MSNPSEIRSDIITHISSNFTSYPIAYDNIEFRGDKSKPFVELSIEFREGKSVIKGTGTETRYDGVIACTIRTPVLSGTKIQTEIMTELANVLERKRLTHLTTRAGRSYPIKSRNEYDTLVYIVQFVSA